MKRPLTWLMVVFIWILFFLQKWNESLFQNSTVNSTADGASCLYGYLQDDWVMMYGTITDYSFHNQYEQLTTELILKNVYLVLTNQNNSDFNSTKEKMQYIQWNNSRLQDNCNSSRNNSLQSVGMDFAQKEGENILPVTRKGQRVLVYIDGKQSAAIGSKVILSGKLSFFQKASNPGEFDAYKYYQNRDILFALKKGKIQKISLNRYGLLQNLKEFRLRQEQILNEFLPINNAAIMKAMLFGNKKELDEEIKTLYQNNGIAHILAISGLHISLIGMSVYRLLSKLPVWRILILCGSEIFLLLYGCMVGFSASTFRAIFMFTFFLLSKLLKRSYDMITAAALSAGVQLLIHPGYLFDCGFQLSYMAIAGMAVLLPALQKMSEIIKPVSLQKGIVLFLPSISVTLTTAPVLIYHYYELSFFSIGLNFIVLPLMAPLLLSGIGLLGAANLLEGMTGIPVQISAFIVNGILWVFETGCHILEWLSVGRMNIAPLSGITTMLYYGLLLAMTVWGNKKRHIYQFIFPIIGILCLLFPKRAAFSAWMLDVGQGDSNVILTKEGKVFIIDCGSTSKYNVGKKILIPFLKYNGIHTVDGIIITHPDQDHMNGILELLELGEEENLSISQIYIYESAIKNESENWQELLNLARQQQVPVARIGQGDSLQTESLELKCLYPLDKQEGLTGNSASLVMQLTVEWNENETFRLNEKFWKDESAKQLNRDFEKQKFTILYMGDLEQNGEKLLLKEYEQEESSVYDLKCDVLKVGHHGSSSSSSCEFLQKTEPECAIISCGEKNVYGHPHEETRKRLEAEKIPYLITYEEGAMCFGEDGFHNF